MGGSANAIQRIIHTLEVGWAAAWVRRALVVGLIAGLALFYLLNEFRGLATSEAMDQAQIGRGLLHGQLWKSEFARPLAVGQLQHRGKTVATRIWDDTFNAPLPPLIDAIALLPVRSHLGPPQGAIYLGDRMIALMSILLFLASVVVLFFLARRLFDQRLAGIACALVLLGDFFWQYSLSGLPQMLLLLLFNATIYALVRAIDEKVAEQPVERWLGAAGLGFALLALAHALTIWIFLAALIFCGIYFRPRLRALLWLLAPFLCLYLPWMLRNFLLCGNPAGLAFYALFDQLGGTEAGIMRQLGFDWHSLGLSAVLAKVNDNVIDQTSRIFQYLGSSVIALFFFAALLHPFRRATTAATRWLILALWAGAFIGMTLYGIHPEQGVAANQLHLLFVPIMISFGLAFLLVQWSRLGFAGRLPQLAFITLLFVLSVWPMVFNLFFAAAKPGFRWPPYVPAYIAVMNKWMKPDEIIASDVPWAVAWYADRHAVWLPENVKTFTQLSDYRILGGPINGLYLTPVSGSENTLQDVLKGDYKDWSSVILRSGTPEQFPLKWGALLGLNGECLFMSDYDREKAAATTK